MVSINYAPIPVFETSFCDSTYIKNSGGKKIKCMDRLFGLCSYFTNSDILTLYSED
jgi:hypothetical protein